MTAEATAEGEAENEIKRTAVEAELGDEFTEKKFREMKQFDSEAVDAAVEKTQPVV